jgi:hypothetical protein
VADTDYTVAELKAMLAALRAETTPGKGTPGPLAAAIGGAVRAAWDTVKGEPVLTAGVANGVLATVVTLVLRHFGDALGATPSAWALTGITAVTSVYAALRTRPFRASSLTAIASTLTTGAVALGLHVPAMAVGAGTPAAALIVALLLRMHVSPKTAEKVAAVVETFAAGAPAPAVPAAMVPAPAAPVTSVTAPAPTVLTTAPPA